MMSVPSLCNSRKTRSKLPSLLSELCSQQRNAVIRGASGGHRQRTPASPLPPSTCCILTAWQQMCYASSTRCFGGVVGKKMSSVKMTGIFLIFEMSHFALFFLFQGEEKHCNSVQVLRMLQYKQNIKQLNSPSKRMISKKSLNSTSPKRCYISAKLTVKTLSELVPVLGVVSPSPREQLASLLPVYLELCLGPCVDGDHVNDHFKKERQI